MGILGILQPLSDAVKLFRKEFLILYRVALKFFYFCPIFIFVVVCMGWLLYPILNIFYNFEFGILYLICLTSFGLYYLLLSGWLTGSKYSIIGSYRGVVQSISFEIVLFLIFWF